MIAADLNFKKYYVYVEQYDQYLDELCVVENRWPPTITIVRFISAAAFRACLAPVGV